MEDNQLIPNRKKDKWGFCTPDKKIVIDCIYQEVKYFSEGYVPAKLNEKWGFIDENGVVIIPFNYENVAPFYNEIATVVLNGIFYDINNENELMIKPNEPGYEWIFYEPIALVYQREIGSATTNTDASNMSFKEADILSLVYLEKYNSDELDEIEKYLKENDSLILKRYEMTALRKNGKYGYMDNEQRMVIPAIYDDMYNFEKDLARVKFDGKYGYISKEGVQYWED